MGGQPARALSIFKALTWLVCRFSTTGVVQTIVNNIISSAQSKNAPDRIFVKIDFLLAVYYLYEDLSGKKIPTSKIALFPPYFGGSFLHQIVIGTFTQRKKALDRPGADAAAVTVLIANSKQAPSRLVQERLLLLRRLMCKRSSG